jgi:PIN domain nuclease of toxin-antitoxin system
VKVLLDSHVILWWFGQPRELAGQALEALELPDNEIYVSAASWWELGIKRALGRLRFDVAEVSEKLEQANARRLPITFLHAERAAALPAYHGDPFDRMLAAQALSEGLIVMTRDKSFVPYNVPILPA